MKIWAHFLIGNAPIYLIKPIMQKILIYFLVLVPGSLFAQFPEDALRYGYPTMGGTARNMAIGGAMGSLGGDISAAHINPAGIGLYKNSEIVLSPGFLFNNNQYNYRDDNTQSNKSGFGFGTSGFVSGKMNPGYRKATSSAFSLSINQTGNFTNTIQYNGQNTQSSWSEQYVEQLVRDNASTFRQAEEDYILGSSLAFWTFLVDTLSDGAGNIIGYQSLVPISSTGAAAVNQANRINQRGATSEISLAFANNYNDKFYLGGSINVPVYNFRSNQTYREEDATGDLDNDFSFFEFQQDARTTGFGLNAKIGIIAKPIDRLRLGLAFHTPTWAGLTDTYNASMITDTENYTVFQQPATQTSQALIDLNRQNNSSNADRGIYEYNLTTPMRLIGSASFVINEVKDVRQQKGFITADVEYVAHGGVRYSSDLPGDEAYYQSVNEAIRAEYKGAVNIKVGGELKFEKIMARAGFATFGNPYTDFSGLSAKRTLLSGGVGYRHMGMFIDLAYVHGIIRNSHIPYRLEDKPSPIADARNTRGNVMLTLGFKL